MERACARFSICFIKMHLLLFFYKFTLQTLNKELKRKKPQANLYDIPLKKFSRTRMSFQTNMDKNVCFLMTPCELL